jgi:hypothetical protein
MGLEGEARDLSFIFHMLFLVLKKGHEAGHSGAHL